jgi:hypothetical protein
MSAQSTITKLREENTALRGALCDALISLENGEPTKKQRQSIVGNILKSYPLAHDAAFEELKRRELAKSKPGFSPVNAAMANRTSYGAVRRGGTPSQIAKNIAQGKAKP